MSKNKKVTKAKKLLSANALLKEVVTKIGNDIEMGDVDALSELLSFLPKMYLVGYLPEDDWEKYTKNPNKLYEKETKPLCADPKCSYYYLAKTKE
jgi:hypothetical protein